SRRAQGTQQALGCVGLVVALVVHVVDMREGFDDRLGAVTDDRRDACFTTEGGADVLVLLLHDRATIAELSQRLRQRASETRAHSCGEDDGLKSHEYS